MTIEITPQDIIVGEHNVKEAQHNEVIVDRIYTHCPVALACRRAGIPNVRIGTTTLRSGERFIFLPDKAVDFNTKLMQGGDLQPFSMEIMV